MNHWSLLFFYFVSSRLEALCDDDNDDDDYIFKIIEYVLTIIMFSLCPNRHIMIQLMSPRKSNSLFR